MSRGRAGPVALLLGWGMLSVPSGSAAQDAPWRLGAGASFESYSLSSEAAAFETVSLLTLPFAGRADLGRHVTLSAGGAWARGTLSRSDGTEATLSGLTDTRVRLALAVPGDVLRLEAVGYLPTGQSTHDDDEAAVAGVVAADLLPFEISHWGTAGAVAVNASAARAWGAFGAGIAAAYRVSGEFDPVEDAEFTYAPGDELHLRLALDYRMGRSQKVSLSVGLRSFREDVANEANLFQTGDRFEAMGTWAFPVALRAAGALYGGLIHRERGTFLQAIGEDVPTQELILLGGVARAPLGSGFVLPRVDARVFRRDDGMGEGFVVGVGASLEYPLAGLTALPRATVRFGDVDLDRTESSSFTGFQLGLTLRAGDGGS